jgi:hypothetical protein
MDAMSLDERLPSQRELKLFSCCRVLCIEGKTREIDVRTQLVRGTWKDFDRRSIEALIVGYIVAFCIAALAMSSGILVA